MAKKCLMVKAVRKPKFKVREYNRCLGGDEEHIPDHTQGGPHQYDDTDRG